MLTVSEHDQLKAKVDGIIARERGVVRKFVTRRQQTEAFARIFKEIHDVMLTFVDPAIESPTPEPVTLPIVETPNAKQIGKPTWLGAWSGNVRDAVRNAIAQAGDKLPVLISYNIPGRDNGNYSAGGLHSIGEFEQWARDIADGVGDSEAIVIIEPDALALSLELSNEKRDERMGMIQYAIDTIKRCPNVKVFVDASTWVEPLKMANLLTRLTGFDGFSQNVSGYKKTETCITWGDQVSEFCGKPYVLDTSRNGNGNPHEPMWCNVTDTRVGHEPTFDTPSPHCFAFIWAKVPGESDGLQINGDSLDRSKDRHDIPRAGEWWQEFSDAIYSGDWAPFKSKYHV